MSRRKVLRKKQISLDPVYNSLIVSKLINKVMMDGKKSLSQTIVYTALKNIASLKNQDPIEILKKSIENVTPRVEIKARRVGGATYQVPIEISERRGSSLAIRILVTSARARSEKTIISKIENEILDAYNNIGNSVKKKEEIHKIAESNKVYSIFKL